MVIGAAPPFIVVLWVATIAFYTFLFVYFRHDRIGPAYWIMSALAIYWRLRIREAAFGTPLYRRRVAVRLGPGEPRLAGRAYGHPRGLRCGARGPAVVCVHLASAAVIDT